MQAPPSLRIAANSSRLGKMAFDTRTITDAWQGVSANRSFVHPSDERTLTQSTAKFSQGRVPEPWFGNPRLARIFVLTLNPGHGKADDNHSTATQDFFWSMMDCKADYSDYLSGVSQDGLNWGRRHYGSFLERSMSAICNLRLVAYPSPDKASMGNISAAPADVLPTAKLMRDFVHNSLVPAARNGDCLLLVMRSPQAWGFGNPEADSWDNGLFVSRSLRTASITPSSRVGPAIQEWLAKF